MPNTVKLRRGTAIQWAANNPVLASGEVGVELSVDGTPQALKIGNGISTWNALPYFVKAGGVPQPLAYGSAGASGTSVEYARSDHIHAVSGFATPDDVEESYQRTIKGANLFTNGTLFLGNNYNFNELEFDGHEAPPGCAGSFKHTGRYTAKVSNEFMPVNPKKRYLLSFYAKGTGGIIYSYLAMYDADKLLIDNSHNGYTVGTLTTLTQALSVGDTVVHLADVSAWEIKTYSGYNGFIFWCYANSYGFVYPPLSYSRYVYGNRFNNVSQIDYVNNTITLTAPWNGREFPSGTQVSQRGPSVGTYRYVGAVGKPLTSEWQFIKGYMVGEQEVAPGANNLFFPWTAFVKIGLLCNYGDTNPTSTTEQWFGGFKLLEVDEDTFDGAVAKTGDTMTGLLSIESTQSGATTEVLYLKNNQTGNDTAAAVYFGFSTAANYYHAAIVASRTNLGGAHASKLEFMVRRAIEGVGKTFLASLFTLYYNNQTPHAALAASLGVQITGNPSEAVDVNGNLRLRNIPTTVGTFCIEVDNNGVFRKRTFAQTLADLGASEAIHTHTISDLSGVAPLVHNHDDDYVSLTGEQTLTNISDKQNMWMPFALLTIENDAVYKNSAEYCGVLHMQSYSDSREPQEMFNIYVYMQKRGWNTNQEFTNQVPELVICLDGNHNLASNDVVAIMTDTDSVSQVFTFYIRLSASNKSYRTKITSGKGISYGRQYGDANDSYVTLTAITEAPAQAVLPTPAKGDVVEASLLTQVVPNSEVLTIHKKVNLQNQLTLAGTSILQRNSAGTLTVRTFAQTISDMNLLTTSHDALFDVHGRVTAQYFSDLAQESDKLGRLAWLAEEKRMAYGLDYGGKDGLWQYLGITKVFTTVNDLMSETPTSEGIIACAITEQIAFVSYWTGSVYQWKALVNESALLRRSCLPWASLPSSPTDGHFQISYDKDVISFYYSTGGWRHLPVDSVQRIASPDDDYDIDPILDKLILVDCTNSDVTITMPVIAQSMGREFIIRHHKGENAVKIVGQPNNTVDGQTTITLTTVKDFVRLINDGNSDWCLVGGAYS